jgi:hypothetical protein
MQALVFSTNITSLWLSIEKHSSLFCLSVIGEEKSFIALTPVGGAQNLLNLAYLKIGIKHCSKTKVQCYKTFYGHNI